MLSMLKARARVLLFDDDLSMQRLIVALLRREGYRVDVVSAGADAITKMDRNEYAVVLLDLMAPTEGGLTVIKHLQEKHPEMLERVILVTASPASVVQSVRRHVAGVVLKPFEAAELVAAVGRVVSR